MLTATTVTDARHEIEQLRSGSRPTPGARTLDSLAAECFDSMQAAAKRGKLSQLTVDNARSRYKHVSPVLGHRGAADLVPADVRRLINVLEDKLAPSSATDCLRVLSRVLSFGMEVQELQRNVVRDIPRSWRPGLRSTKEPNVLREAEVERLLEAMQKSAHRPVAALCFYAGLRVSEAIGLQWRDLDFVAGAISVERQRGPAGDFLPLKTPTSRRTVPMLPALKRELQALDRPTNAHPTAPLFPQATRWLASRAVRRAGNRCGLGTASKPLGCHDLRHSIGSEMLAHGTPITDVSRFLGHANVQTTARVYAHSLDTGLTATAQRLTASGFGV